MSFLGQNAYGGAIPATIWRKFMTRPPRVSRAVPTTGRPTPPAASPASGTGISSPSSSLGSGSTTTTIGHAPSSTTTTTAPASTTTVGAAHHRRPDDGAAHHRGTPDDGPAVMGGERSGAAHAVTPGCRRCPPGGWPTRESEIRGAEGWGRGRVRAARAGSGCGTRSTSAPRHRRDLARGIPRFGRSRRGDEPAARLRRRARSSHRCRSRQTTLLALWSASLPAGAFGIRVSRCERHLPGGRRLPSLGVAPGQVICLDFRNRRQPWGAGRT